MEAAATASLSRRAAIRLGAGGLAAALAARGVASAAAQEATPAGGTGAHAATTAHPLVGVWIVTSDDVGGVDLATFHADGTSQVSTPDGSVGYGPWRPTGPDTADQTIVFRVVEDGQDAGMVWVRASLTLDGPDALTVDYTVEFVGADGSTTGQAGPATSHGTRVNVEPMGTPVGTMEDVFGEEGGTPTP
jgi:hypothetical protein